MSEEIGVKFLAEKTGQLEIEVTLAHPDGWALPVPGHRPNWANVLLQALGYAVDDAPAPLVWSVAESIDSVRLVSLTGHPRVEESDRPVMVVRLEMQGAAGPFDVARGTDRECFVANAVREGWGAGSRTHRADAYRVEPPPGARRWTHKALAALGRGSPLGPDVALAELARAGREWGWALALEQVLSWRAERDVLPMILDHFHERIPVSALVELRDTRVDDAIAVAAGDPAFAPEAVAAIGIMGADATSTQKAVLARVVEAQRAGSVFKARIANRLFANTLDWAGAHVMGDPLCAKRFAKLSKSRRGVIENAILKAAPEPMHEALRASFERY